MVLGLYHSQVGLAVSTPLDYGDDFRDSTGDVGADPLDLVFESRIGTVDANEATPDDLLVLLVRDEDGHRTDIFGGHRNPPALFLYIMVPITYIESMLLFKIV